ncbi:hypothetical protein [Dactylosporangium sp. NPDC049140]|uniref:AfsR/SARP family transcriptional regulator n=1 Tax=Dactylosporangium sp. NPDC049140 TaxID=3155647 RepID=UPI0033F682BD
MAMRTLWRLLRAAGAAVALLVGLTVLPAVLIVVQGAVVWDWRAMLGDPQSAVTLLALGLGVGWLLWAALLVTVVTDTVAAVRGLRRVSWLPVSLQSAVTAATGGVLLAVHAARGGGTGPDIIAGTLPVVAAVAVDADTDQVGSPPAGAAAPAVAAGLQVPGGWLPLPVAAAVGAAVALAWAQRRRDYRPRPPAGWRRHDPDLDPPAAPLRHLLHAVRAAADDGLPDTSGPPDPGDPAQPGGTEPTADSGTDANAGGLAPTVLDLLPAGDLQLTGPGRHDAGRGLLVALSVLPTGRPRIVPTAGFAAAVLGVPPARIGNGPAPAAATSNDQGAAAGVVVFAGPEPDAAASVDSRPDRPVGPGPGAAQAVRCTIRVDTAPIAGVCWHVAADGSVHAVTGPAPALGRLPVLDQRTTLDILTSIGVVTPPAADTTPPPASRRPEHGPDSPGTAGVDGWPDPPPDTAGQPRRLLVRVLGEVRVVRPHPDGSHSPVPVRRSAGQQILVLLALHRDGLDDGALRTAIWPDVPGSTAQPRYATTMSELRRVLHDAAGRPALIQDPGGGTRPRHTHRLDPAAVQVDVWRLQGLLDAAASTDNPRYRRMLLAAAAAVSGGELAAGWSYPWLLEARERVARHLLDVAAHLADTEPDHHTALRVLHQALHLAPTNEHLHRRVLQRHAAAGDRDGLRRAAATLADHLTAHNLQAEPDTVALLTALLTGPPGPPAGGADVRATPGGGL